MTRLEYVEAFPFDVTVNNSLQPTQSVRFRMFRCPSKECGDHPVIQIHDPPDEPDRDAMKIPVVSADAGLGGLLASVGSMAKMGAPEAWDLAQSLIDYRKGMHEACPTLAGEKHLH